MFRGRLEAVLYPSVTRDGLLICTGVEESYIERILLVLYLGQEDRICVGIRVIIVLTVARQTSKEDTLVFLVPFIDRKTAGWS